MTELTGKGILSGRPFGGVAILVRSNIAKNCHLVHKCERFVIAEVIAKKWLPWQRPLVALYWQYVHSVGRPLKPPP